MTSDSKQSLIVLCLGKYLSKSFETLKVETTRHCAKDLRKKLAVIAMMSVPGPFNRHHEMKHNWAITHQNHLEFWNQKAKQGFSQQSKNFGPWANTFGPRPFNVKSLKEAWEWLTSKFLLLPITHHLGLSMYKVLLDSDKYLLSYSALINPARARCPPHGVTNFINFDWFLPRPLCHFFDHFSNL